MQSDVHQLYSITSERTKKPIQLYKDVGTCVFSSLHAHLRRPGSLITKLRGIGMWYLRKKRMEIVLNMFPPDFEKTLEDFPTHISLITYENRIEIYEIFQKRMEEYKEYIQLRDEIRKERFKTQRLLQPNED